MVSIAFKEVNQDPLININGISQSEKGDTHEVAIKILNSTELIKNHVDHLERRINVLNERQLNMFIIGVGLFIYYQLDQMLYQS